MNKNHLKINRQEIFITKKDGSFPFLQAKIVLHTKNMDKLTNEEY